MRILVVLVLAFVVNCIAVPKPMESIANYNVMMVHGAYGSSKGFGNKDFVESLLKKNLPEAIDTLPDWSLSKTMYKLDTIPRIANSYVFPEANEDTSFLGEANGASDAAPVTPRLAPPAHSLTNHFFTKCCIYK